jgi:hypothetical protein
MVKGVPSCDGTAFFFVSRKGAKIFISRKDAKAQRKDARQNIKYIKILRLCDLVSLRENSLLSTRFLTGN